MPVLFKKAKAVFPCNEQHFFFFLVSRPGIEPQTLAVKAQSPNVWTTREFPRALSSVPENRTFSFFSAVILRFSAGIPVSCLCLYHSASLQPTSLLLKWLKYAGEVSLTVFRFYPKLTFWAECAFADIHKTTGLPQLPPYFFFPHCIPSTGNIRYWSFSILKLKVSWSAVSVIKLWSLSCKPMLCWVLGQGPCKLHSSFSCRHPVQLSSVVSDSATPCAAACQVSLPITNSWSLLKLLSIESVMPSNHLLLCPLLLLPSIFPSIRVFSNESVLRIRWPKYWSLSLASVLPMNIQDGFPLGLTGWISFKSKGLSRVFSNTTVQKHQFFGA